MLRKALAWAALLLAGSVLGAELMVYVDSGRYATLDVGGVWQSLAPASLIWVEEKVIAWLSPALWDPGFVTVLKAPLWAVAAALGLILYPWGQG